MSRLTIAEKLLLDSIFEIAHLNRPSLIPLRSSNTIILLRKRLRMSQRTLAKRAGLPQATLSRIESGKVEPALKL